MQRSTRGLGRQTFNLIGEYNLLMGSNPIRCTNSTNYYISSEKCGGSRNGHQAPD